LSAPESKLIPNGSTKFVNLNVGVEKKKKKEKARHVF